MGKQVNRTELAELHDVSLPTVSAWVRKGCPVIERGGKGKQWIFDSAAVATWREDQAVLSAVGDTDKLDIDEARRRKTAAEAALAELELSKQKGEVAEIELISKVIGEEYAKCRAKLLSIPTRLSPLLMTIDGEGDAGQILEDAITDALSELSSDDLEDFEITETAAAESQTTTETDGQ